MKKQTKYADPKGRHIRVYSALLNSPAYRVLGFAAKALFFDLRDGITGTNNGNLSASLSDLRHRGWASSSTLSKALYELRAMGFIAVTRAGGLKLGTRVCNLYRFTDLEVYEQPKVGVQAVKATHDYLKLATVKAAEHALAEGMAVLADEGRRKQVGKKNPPVRNANPISSELKPIERFISSDSEQGTPLSVSNPNRGVSCQIS